MDLHQMGAELTRRYLSGAIQVRAEDICEGDILRGSDERRFQVNEVELKPKTVVLRLLLLDQPPEHPFRLRRGEMVEVERG